MAQGRNVHGEADRREAQYTNYFLAKSAFFGRFRQRQSAHGALFGDVHYFFEARVAKLVPALHGHKFNVFFHTYWALCHVLFTIL
jgi:hypothetical protein